jgi:4-hydroxybenzoate polyprenyltransferase
MRPKQWTKNAVVLAPVIFARKAGDESSLVTGLAAVLIFSLTAGATYIVNDLRDLAKDRQHPTKSRRPIVSGAISPSAALAAAVGVFLLSLAGALLIRPAFAGYVAAYALLSLLYSLVLKRVVIIDVMTIAAGFVLRVEAGASAVGVGVSQWLFLCTILLALFLGFGKRRHELVLLEGRADTHREILREYSPYFLDQMIGVVTASTVIAYSLYTLSPEVASKLGTTRLYLTIPFVLYGIFRYLYLIHQREEGGSPSTLLLNDRPLLVTVLLWIAAVIGLLYLS